MPDVSLWRILAGGAHMSTQSRGYYRFPTIHHDRVAFVAEDDLWLVSAKGGTARRLTANLGPVAHPFFSPDGEWLAFVGSEEGHPEVYVMAASGGPARRLTFLGSNTVVVGWRNESILFASTAGQPFRHDFWLYEVDLEGNEPQKLPLGVASAVSLGPAGVVIGRNTGDPARWKRYRGGTAGELWIDEAGTGQFHKLIVLAGNLANPMWIGHRIYFLSDHEGVGNIYSCTPKGEDLQKHTDHRDFYARNAASDGQRIVYHAGADIYVFDPAMSQAHQVEIEYHSPQVQRSRKFVEPDQYLEDYALSRDGSHLALVSRGQTFTMGNWEGPILQHGIRNGVRYRLTRYLNDGKRLILASDEEGTDHLELHTVDGSAPPRKYLDLDVGRPQDIKVSPASDEIALTNHRHELVRVDLESGEAVVIERSNHGPIAGFNWSPDGRWIAYAHAPSPRVRVIKLYDAEGDQSYEVTEPLLQDFAPVFDPEGKYLFFLSTRVFDPVYDNLHFDLNFPRGVRPYAITLRKDLPSPFIPGPRGLEKSKNDESPSPTGNGDPGHGAAGEQGQAPEEEATWVTIDLDSIADRIVAFPVGEAIYGTIDAIKGRVFYTVYPIQGARDRKWFDPEPPARASLKMFDLETLEESVFVDRVTSFALSGDGSAMACRIGKRLRVIRARRDPTRELTSEEKPGRKSGWIDLSRLRISVEPSSEWQQMFHEAWRLQRDYFWVEDMSGVDWEKVLRRYDSLVGRVACRSEFSDLLWEMQGELGTSHCYELGGDYRPQPQYKLGFLGVDLGYDPDHDAYRFRQILKGDVWDEKFASPLRRPGVNIEEGMLLLAIGGQQLSRECLPSELLVNQAGQEVQLTIAGSDGGSPRTVSVKAASDEMPIRYRDWVEANRKYVHEKSGGQVGYIHVPDMGPDGFAEFHRYFLMELDHSGLIVDVRYNGGGHVSALLLEKLARKRLGYDLSRWMGLVPYPEESVRGPVVALTNEQAGSDGDIFSHAFKLMNLGKLIGRRTWGGVIGIWPRNWLVDGTLTTQPEFSFWFKDVGWGVENYGTDPDIEVDITPQDYVQGVDAQLDRAIDEVLQAIEENPPLEPDFGNRPRRTLPA
jgi:tricorn protease